MPAQYFIVPRRTPNWPDLADGFRRDGRYTESDFIPAVLPPGFPDNLAARIDLWNDTLKVDFFACRARLAQIAESSWAQVVGAKMLRGEVAVQQAVQANGGARMRFLFVDDDDWFAPDLPQRLESEIGSRAAILRWAAPLFNGSWQARIQPGFAPRWCVKTYLYARSRPLLESVYRRVVTWLPQDPRCPLVPGDHLLYTNNYVVTERYLDCFNDLGCVADHSDASKLAMVSRLRLQSRPRLMLSAANKHPCSAGVIGRAGSGHGAAQRLRTNVEDYVRRGRRCAVPAALAWTKPLVDQTLDVFEAAL